MFEILAEPELSAWFEALASSHAPQTGWSWQPLRATFTELGEALDRAYYGDSVRRAERRWCSYLERQLAASEAR